MLILIILIALAIIIGAIYWLIRSEEPGVVLGLAGIMLFTLLMPLAPLITMITGERTFTGYVYSVEDNFNRTDGHIRFSENAGKDEQPSFCVVRGSEEAEKLKELAGSGKKVKVIVPEGFSVQMWYGQCPLPATITEVGDE